jgi:uncharacterized DUF497 family protein
VNFEWDPRKAVANLTRHGVSFEEAASVFADWHSITVPDPGHSVGEARFYLLGMSNKGSLLVVCHTDRGENTRIISSWRANARQRKQYEEGS